MSDRPLSVLALNVLMAASRSPAGVRVRDLVDAVERFEGHARSVARVQISRVRRLLWRAGLVELHSRRHCDGTMTERVIAGHEIAARAFRTPRIVLSVRGGATR